MIRWGDIKQRIKQSAATSGCSEEQARLLTDEAVTILTDKIICVGSIANIEIRTFVDSFPLPFNMERALEVSQCDCDGELNQGWFNVTNGSTYVDPAQCGDAAIIDKGLLPYEHKLMGPAYIGVRPDYDEPVTVTIRAMKGGAPAIFAAGEDKHPTEALELTSAYPQTVWSVSTVDDITEIRKTLSQGPVRILARDAVSGIVYLVAYVESEELQVQRRHYRFPELSGCDISIRSVDVSTTEGINAIQVDTNNDSAPVCIGQPLYFSGFTPSSFNGIRTVTSIAGSSFYIQNSGVSTDKPECIGRIRMKSAINVSALWRRIPITSDNSVIPVRNITALRMAVSGLSKLAAGDMAAFDSMVAGAVGLLTAECARYGLDPINQMDRKAQYRYEVTKCPQNSLGYVRGRMALEVPGGLLIGKSDWTRLINEAVELIVTTGNYGSSTIDRVLHVCDDGKVLLPPEALTILSASLNGTRPVELQDRFWSTTVEGGGYIYANPYVGTRYESYTGGASVIPMVDSGEIIDENGCRRKVYWLPCGFRKCFIKAVCKARFTLVTSARGELDITNYVALKMMCEALLAKSKNDYSGYRVLVGESMAVLKREDSEARGGAQGTINRSTGGARGAGTLGRLRR